MFLLLVNKDFFNTCLGYAVIYYNPHCILSYISLPSRMQTYVCAKKILKQEKIAI